MNTDIQQVKRLYREMWELEYFMTKAERLDTNWRNTSAGLSLLEKYSRAVDAVVQIDLDWQTIRAMLLSLDPGYGGSF